ncbi:hypothetical protein BEWA_008620 [Theileria equi strain WA]|uniref:DIX domain-containing protein n=1 Tax=Theileria equi strain WA TaxID=1537102 RepID=L0B2L3_THEEQ|nr:hypothetical protein BEWA_008620 [Theileria equi strain WA]AFZ81451.1 hypothetical protein BEWA_008620 [Theileria equi strain WA]|eukprot:XP_004831117.1 hypothetical protein BEWA_008620 [Theileria equi strain WA]
MNERTHRLLLYVISNDDDNWETPNALLIPLKSPDSSVTLGDLRKIFPIPGTYHYRIKSKHGNGFVWLDVTRDDEILRHVDNVIYMKILRVKVESDCKFVPNTEQYDLFPKEPNSKDSDFDLIFS